MLYRGARPLMVSPVALSDVISAWTITAAYPSMTPLYITALDFLRITCTKFFARLKT